MLQILSLKQLSVPEYNVFELKKKSSKYCLIIPVFNEGEYFRAQIEKMKDLGIFNLIDVIVADANSNDGSTEPIMLEKCGFKALCVRKGKGRYSTDLRMSSHYAFSQGYEGIILVDGNNKDDLSALPMFIDKLDQDYDYIQGSRFIKGGKEIRTPLSRLFAIKFICTPILSLAARRIVSDGTNGFRAYSKRFLLDNRVLAFRENFNKYEWTYYLPARAGALKFKCIEIPVTRVYPINGEVPTKVNAKANFEVIILLLKIIFGFFNPSKQQIQEVGEI